MILRCIAPRKRLRFNGDRCGGYVDNIPDWMVPEIVGLLAHSDFKGQNSLAPSCKRCGYVHEVALRGVVPLRSAA